MENVIINFTSDPSGLEPGLTGMDQLNDKDKQLELQAKKTMDAYQSRDKSVIDSGNNAKKSLDSLLTTVSTINKSVIGGNFTKTIDQLRSQMKLTDDQLKIFYQNIIKTGSATLIKTTNKDDAQQLTVLINAATTALNSMGNTVDVTGEKHESFRTRLRALREEMNQLETAGNDDSAAFQNLQLSAAKVEEQINITNERVRALASPTFAFEAIISGAQGIAGAFAVANGSMALFGSEDEDVQKALLKVNAAMSILQGLMAIQNVLQKQSAASIAINLLLKKQDVALTEAQTVANEGAIGAQKGLNVATVATTESTKEMGVAFLASPTGLLITGIAAITAALIAFGSTEDKVGEKIKKYNDLLDDQFTSFRKLASDDSQLKAQDDLITELQQTVDAKRAAGASDAELATQDLRLTNERIKREELVKQSVVDTGKKVGLSYEEAKTQLDSLLDKQEKIINLQRVTPEGSTGLFSTVEQEMDHANQKTLADAKVAIDSRIKLLDDFISASKDNEDKRVELSGQANAQIKEIERQSFLDSLKSARAFADARVLIAQVGSREELNARIDAIRAAEIEELADVNLTAGERIKIEAQAAKEIKDLQNQFDVTSAKNAQTFVDAKTLLAKKGSKEELDFKLQSLELGYVADITDKKKNVADLELIDAQYLANRKKLLDEFNQKTAEDAINARIQELNATVSNISSTNPDQANAKLLAAKKQLVDEEAALELVGVQLSQDNEELKRQKINAIYAKELADKKELERQKASAEIEQGSTFINALLDKQIANDQRILDSDKATFAQKEKAQQELFDFTKAKIDEEATVNVQKFAQGLEDEETFQANKFAIQQKYDDLSVKEEQAAQAKKDAIRSFAQQTALNLETVLFNIESSHIEAEKTQTQDLLDKKIISQDEYNNRVKIIRRKQAEDEKAQAIFSTLIQQAPALLKAFTQGGFPAVVAAATLFFALLTDVTNTPVPQFREGEVGIQGPGTETSDSIVARISKNESVINAKQTKKHEGALRAINEDRFMDYILKYELPKIEAKEKMSVDESGKLKKEIIIEKINNNPVKFLFDVAAMQKMFSQIQPIASLPVFTEQKVIVQMPLHFELIRQFESNITKTYTDENIIRKFIESRYLRDSRSENKQLSEDRHITESKKWTDTKAVNENRDFTENSNITEQKAFNQTLIDEKKTLENKLSKKIDTDSHNLDEKISLNENKNKTDNSSIIHSEVFLRSDSSHSEDRKNVTDNRATTENIRLTEAYLVTENKKIFEDRMFREFKNINEAWIEHHVTESRSLSEQRHYDENKSLSESRHLSEMTGVHKTRNHYLINYKLPELYHNLAAPKINSEILKEKEVAIPEFDYNRMAETLARKIAENPQVSLAFDERGFVLSVTENQHTTEYKNKKLMT